jgi:hypothetical protein
MYLDCKEGGDDLNSEINHIHWVIYMILERICKFGEKTEIPERFSQNRKRIKQN